MGFSVYSSYNGVSSLKLDVIWDKIKYNPNQKKKYKFQKEVESFYYTCYLEVDEAIKENVLLNNNDFSVCDTEIKISYNKNGYFDVVFKKDKLTKNKRRPGSLVSNYNMRKEIGGFVFIIQIRMISQSPERYTEQELKNIKKQRRKQRRIEINNSKYIKDNPYPVKVYRGGSCSPK